jgi:predicted transcriptional regulator
MTTQNVTLALPKEILRKAKLLAIQRNTSLSGLLTRALEDVVAREENYQKARKRHSAILRKGLNLGTKGKVTWSREDLHARR